VTDEPWLCRFHKHQERTPGGAKQIVSAEDPPWSRWTPYGEIPAGTTGEDHYDEIDTDTFDAIAGRPW
jgi:hypothetical protein